MVLTLGALWIAFRTFKAPPIVRPTWGSLPLALLIGWVVIQMFHLMIWPIISATGKYMSNPWPWMAFLQIIVILVWFTDSCRAFTFKDLNGLAKTIAIIGVFLALYMVGQSQDFDPLIHYADKTFGGLTWLHGNHIIGLMGNPFHAASTAAVCFPAILALRWHLAAVIALVALTLSGSASGILFAVFGGLAVLWSQRRFFLLKVSGALSLIGLGYGASTADALNEHGRLIIWQQAIEKWHQSPVEGLGLGSFKLLGITDPIPPGYAVRWAHNEWIQVLTELGIIGLSLIAIWVLSLFWNLRRDLRRVPAAWLGMSVTCFGLSILATPWHMAPTVIVTLLCLVALEVSKEKRNA